MRASDGEWGHLSGRIVDGVHRLPIRVYYEDTDFTGLVYHASYLRFMERGRSDFIRILGIDQGELFEQTAKEAPGFHFVVRSMKIDFLKPARVDDVVEVVTYPGEVGGASIVLKQSVVRGGEPLVTADVRIAFVAGEKPQRIPAALRKALRAAD
ncbi:MAG: tol-pal system-associated acyl-CoA thioesterase [Bradyrhizobiaceae bacterium]|nr:tol-pal system-associated acyl-CoA thioesterase [Bradyrhizobiaceae bacterium]